MSLIPLAGRILRGMIPRTCGTVGPRRVQHRSITTGTSSAAAPRDVQKDLLHQLKAHETSQINLLESENKKLRSEIDTLRNKRGKWEAWTPRLVGFGTAALWTMSLFLLGAATAIFVFTHTYKKLMDREEGIEQQAVDRFFREFSLEDSNRSNKFQERNSEENV